MNNSTRATSTKQIKRAFLETEDLQGSNLVKWGGKYDISTPYGLYATGLTCLNNLSVNDWIELARKAYKFQKEVSQRNTSH